jgi:hypothetical protein
MRLYKAACSCLFVASTMLFAESKNPVDYPLRVHIFARNETTFYHNRMLDESKGEGRANLFENGDVHGVDFNFECSEKLKASFGYETYPAKWKKPNQELIVLLPVFGKTGSYFTCNLKTDLKDFAYFSHNGSMGSESSADFKAWMAKHNYDPEHGKDVPTRTEPETAAAQKTTPASTPTPQ